MRPANERRHYNITSSHIGWAHTRNNHCLSVRVSAIIKRRPIILDVSHSIAVTEAKNKAEFVLTSRHARHSILRTRGQAMGCL